MLPLTRLSGGGRGEEKGGREGGLVCWAGGGALPMAGLSSGNEEY